MNRYSDESEEIEEEIPEEIEADDQEEEDEADEDEFLIHIANTLRQREAEDTYLELDPIPDADADADADMDADMDADDDIEDIDINDGLYFMNNDGNSINSVILDDDIPTFDEVYEIFRIHSSNAQLFTNPDYSYNMTNASDQIGQNNTHIYRTESGRELRTHNIGSNEMVCPICQEFLEVSDMASHLVYEHSRFFISYAGTMYRNTTAQDILNIMSMVPPPSSYSDITQMNNEFGIGIGGSLFRTTRFGNSSSSNMRHLINRLVFNEDEEEGDNAPSYEELLRLCEYIGYHKQGIHDIEKVSTKSNVTEETINQDDTCIICLEPLYTKESIRKINKCGHKFCSECIEKWFEENKVCPLCKTDLDVDENIISQSDSVNI